MAYTYRVRIQWLFPSRQPGRPSTRPSVTGWCAMEPERSSTRAPVYPAVSYWVVCDGAEAFANPGARLPGRQLLGRVRWSRSVRQPGRPSTRPSVTGSCAMEPKRSPTRAPVYPAGSYWVVCDGAGAFANPGARLPGRQLLGGVRWSRSVRQPRRPSTRPAATGWCAMEPERPPTRAPVYPAVSYWVVCDGAGASANPGARLPGRQLLGRVRWSRSVRQPGRPSTRSSVTGSCAMEPERPPTRAPVYPAVSYWVVCDGAGASANPGARLRNFFLRLFRAAAIFNCLV